MSKHYSTNLKLTKTNSSEASYAGSDSVNNEHPKQPLGIFPSSWSELRAGRVPGNIPIWVGILSELT
ncbi:MAG: hypothetical protein ACI8SJ_002551, partial [Shewanella sp.]